jgi:hypothetical protein
MSRCKSCAEKKKRFQKELEKRLDGKTSPRELKELRRQESIKARERRIAARDRRIARRNARKKDDE